jgi:hypothetical protein
VITGFVVSWLITSLATHSIPGTATTVGSGPLRDPRLHQHEVIVTEAYADDEHVWAARATRRPNVGRSGVSRLSLCAFRIRRTSAMLPWVCRRRLRRPEPSRQVGRKRPMAHTSSGGRRPYRAGYRPITFCFVRAHSIPNSSARCSTPLPPRSMASCVPLSGTWTI